MLSRTIGDQLGAWSTSYATYPAAGTYAVTDPRNDKPTTYLNPNSSGPTDTTYRTSYTYSTSGDLLTTTNPLGAATTNAYTTGSEAAVGGGTEPAGLLATQTDPLGKVTSYAYTSAGDLAQVLTPSGLKTSYTSDNLGRRTGQTDVSDTFPNGITTTLAYDGNDRLLSHTGPAATDAVTGTVHTPQVSFTYDPDGDVLTRTVSDTTGGDTRRVTTNTYDTHDQLATTTDPASRKISYGYDGYGNRTSVTDPAGNVYAVTYDPDGHQLTTTLKQWTGDPTNPSSATDLMLDSRAYDPDGLLASDTDAMGRTHAYWYWADRRLGEEDLANFHQPDGSTTSLALINYNYDAAGNLGYVYTLDNLDTQYQRDAGGRIVQETDDFNNYSGNGTGINRVTANTYDADDHLTSRAVTNGSVTEQTDYTYDAIGDRTSQTVHNGSTNLVTTWTYDQRGTVTSMVDPRGNVTGGTPATYTTTYTSDAADRLTTVTQPVVNAESGGSNPIAVHPITEIGYNTFGDRTSTSDPVGNITSYTYDADGELLGTSAPAYTPPGSSTAITPTATQTFDSLGRVASTTDPNGNTTTNTYDQLDRLAQKTLPAVGGTSSTWHYTYDLDGEQLTATDPTGAQTQCR
ncbi:hypothetical protein GTS_50830 [Gandjariella thermophila]|uniref:Type IV secretion protein Rhs n=1 Tax=Gandjariella thermophila TaxID=1931992 RepID=A0A4D4JEI6_9PSEU|nr:hypothetical protein GTS_50830 [Gandjariella thermophila]